MKIAKQINAILCDDFRQETGGKFSLMGIYPKGIVFSKLPAVLPKICLNIFMEDIKTEFSNCEVTLITPDSKPISINVRIPDNPVGSDANIVAAFMPVRVMAPGDAKFQVRFDNRKRPSFIYRFKIQQAPQPKGK